MVIFISSKHNNAYPLDLLEEYRVHATFNVIDLTAFVGNTYDEVETIDLRKIFFKREGMMAKPSTKNQPLGQWLEESKKSRTQLLQGGTFFYTSLKEP